MSLSASFNYTESHTAANLIALALRRLGVLDAGETINSTEESNALITLNLIVKEWTAEGADVWTRKTGILFLESPGEVRSYTIGSGGDASFASGYAMTTLASAAAAAATTVTVTDDTNIADTDNILVEQDDGTFHVTTVSGSPAANVVTLTAGMASAAAAGNYVYSFTTSQDIGHKLAELVYVSRKLQDNTDDDTNTTTMPGLESEVTIVGEEEYRRLSDKLQTGAPVNIWHRHGPVDSEVFIWPTGGSGFDKLIVEYVAHMDDLDATTNNFYLPPEGFNALAWQLAAEMAPEYGASEKEQQRLWSVANRKRDTFFDLMVEDASVIFSREGTRR